MQQANRGGCEQAGQMTEKTVCCQNIILHATHTCHTDETHSVKIYTEGIIE